jgi:hypothetical protein
MTPTEVKLCYKREVDAQPVPQSQKMSLPRSFGGESPAQCLEPLLLVCDSNDWTPDAQAAEEEREKERKREREIYNIYIYYIKYINGSIDNDKNPCGLKIICVFCCPIFWG